MNFCRPSISFRVPSHLQRLLPDRGGMAAIEFAIVAPVFLTMLIGIFDIGQMAYGRSVLSGAAQNAARSSALETANTTRADEAIREKVAPILPGAEVSSTRVSYYDFSDIGRAERWNDADSDGTCDDGEIYVDENGSGGWDADIGVIGNGGASDVVVYTVTATYTPVFKVPFAPESWNERRLTVSLVRKNQPFADQEEYGSEAGVCT